MFLLCLDLKGHVITYICHDSVLYVADICTRDVIHKSKISTVNFQVNIMVNLKLVICICCIPCN